MRAREFFFGGSALPSLGVPHPDCGPGEGSLSTTGVAYVFRIFFGGGLLENSAQFAPPSWTSL